MTMKQPLVPTRIVNKNGVPTTVYKTPQGKTAIVLIPAPEVSDPNVPQSDAQKVLDRIHKVMNHWSDSMKIPDSVNRDALGSKLFALPDETKRLMAESAARNENDQYYTYAVISMLHMDRSPKEIDDVLYCYDNTKDYVMMSINDDWTEHGFDVDYGILGTLDWTRQYNGRVEGFEFRSGDNSLPLRDYDEKTRAQVMALVDATNYFAETEDFMSIFTLMDTKDEAGQTTLQIRDTALAQLFVDMPERYSEIHQIMREREILDAELIRSILTNAAPALNNGIL
jgi:hypothetical protein